MMGNRDKQVSVDPGRVIDALRQQVAEMSLTLAMMTARAEQAEERVAELEAGTDEQP